MSAADRILRRMRVRKSGWKPDDFRTLYEGFGFEAREGANHTVYQHPDHPHLVSTVARHNKLAPAYARDAIERIDELQQLQAEEESAEGQLDEHE
jgi:hypothetical protein